MDKASFVYVIYISTTPEKLWNALLDGEMTKDYWGRHRNVSDWKVGSKWEHQDYDDPTKVAITGEVLEFDPPRRLAFTWAHPGEAADPAKRSRVTFELEPVYGEVRLTLTHDELEDGSKMHQGISMGWPAILSSLKTLLETGKPMPMTTRQWKGDAA